MRNTTAIIVAAAVLAGCATAPIFTGAGIQVVACELSKAKPAAKAPLHAAGLVLKAFTGDAPPTQAEFAQAVAAIPKSDAVTQAEVEAMWVAVVQAYGLAYSDARTPEQKAQLKVWLSAVGNALDAGSTCGSVEPQALASRYVSPPRKVTFADLAEEMKASLNGVK